MKLLMRSAYKRTRLRFCVEHHLCAQFRFAHSSKKILSENQISHVMFKLSMIVTTFEMSYLLEPHSKQNLKTLL